MTDIVFRGKRADGKGWVEGRVFIALNIGGENIIFIVNHGERANASIDESFNLVDLETFGCRIIPETFGRYIGINDKDGKMIFDSDIIHIDYTEYLLEEPSFVNYVALVDFCDGAIIASSDSEYGDRFIAELPSDSISVIGNIHDNPELFGTSEQLEVEK